MHRGYIKLWRKSIDSGLLQNSEVWQFFCWMLLKVTHKKCKILVGKTLVNLEAGQFIFGRKKAASELKTTERKIRTSLELLKNMEILTINVTNKYSIITLINWDVYNNNDQQNDQQNDQRATNKRPANDQQTTTNKNVNNIRTEEHKKKKRGGATPSPSKLTFGEFGNVKLTEQEYQNLHERFNSHADEKIKALDLYIGSKGDKYKSHYMTILQWSRKDNSTTQQGQRPTATTQWQQDRQNMQDMAKMALELREQEKENGFKAIDIN